MRIFIVGATGVLGRALLPLLLQKGCIVRTLARTPEKVRALELAGVEAVELVDVVGVNHSATAVGGEPIRAKAAGGNLDVLVGPRGVQGPPHLAGGVW